MAGDPQVVMAVVGLLVAAVVIGLIFASPLARGIGRRPATWTHEPSHVDEPSSADEGLVDSTLTEAGTPEPGPWSTDRPRRDSRWT